MESSNFASFLCFLALRRPEGESSIFSSAPLGFYILGSMLMLVGAKYLAGWCPPPLPH